MIGHDPIVEYVLPWSLFAMARGEQWDGILSYPKPSESTPSTLAFWHYARAIAHFSRGDVLAARGEMEQFKTAQAKVPADS